MKATNRTSIAWIPRRKVQAIVAEIGAAIAADVADDPAAGVIVVVATDEVDMVAGTVTVVTAAGVTRIVFLRQDTAKPGISQARKAAEEDCGLASLGKSKPIYFS